LSSLYVKSLRWFQPPHHRRRRRGAISTLRRQLVAVMGIATRESSPPNPSRSCAGNRSDDKTARTSHQGVRCVCPPLREERGVLQTRHITTHQLSMAHPHHIPNADAAPSPLAAIPSKVAQSLMPSHPPVSSPFRFETDSHRRRRRPAINANKKGGRDLPSPSFSDFLAVVEQHTLDPCWG
jgi:hypothetical protein